MVLTRTLCIYDYFPGHKWVYSAIIVVSVYGIKLMRKYSARINYSRVKGDWSRLTCVEVPEVTVWILTSSFLQVTMSPTFILVKLGLKNMRLLGDEAPRTMATLVDFPRAIVN